MENEVYFKRLIQICCFGRSGSNLIWSFIASSPEMLSLAREFHEFAYDDSKWQRRAFQSWVKLGKMESWRQQIFRQKINRAYSYALKTPPLNESAPGNRYDASELENVGHTFKVMGMDALHVDLLGGLYDASDAIIFLRHPYAIAEGHIRRVGHAERVATHIAKCLDLFKALMEREIGPSRLYKYESLIEDVNAFVVRLFSDLDLSIPAKRHFLFKEKPIFGDADHVAKTQNLSYEWRSLDYICRQLRPSVNEKQFASLSLDDQATVRSILGEYLGYFDYPEM